jgi:hypothetical protein
MEIVVAAFVTGAFTFAGVWLTVRRPMKNEHRANVSINEANQRALGRIEGAVQIISAQVEAADDKIDAHIDAHARGDYR